MKLRGKNFFVTGWSPDLVKVMSSVSLKRVWTDTKEDSDDVKELIIFDREK